jgi:hypothetical protein
MTYNPLTREILSVSDYVGRLAKLSLVADLISELANDDSSPQQIERIRVLSEYLRADIDDYSDSIGASFKRALKLSKKIDNFESVAE